MNDEFIKKAPAWWLDWRDEVCVIVAAGPTANKVDLTSAKGKAKFIAINSSHSLVPWADVLYGCDAMWWNAYKGVPGFAGLKITQDEKLKNNDWGIKRVFIIKGHDMLLTAEPAKLGWGGNSGFHALNLAVQFGVRAIILVGYDMHLRAGLHWHGSHVRGLNNPTKNNVERWRRVVDEASGPIKQLGIKVINCSEISELRNYPKMSFENAMQELMPVKELVE